MTRRAAGARLAGELADAVEAALLAFEDGLFKVFVGDARTRRDDGPVELADGAACCSCGWCRWREADRHADRGRGGRPAGALHDPEWRDAARRRVGRAAGAAARARRALLAAGPPVAGREDVDRLPGRAAGGGRALDELPRGRPGRS